ncbi:MAG: glycosyltransferase [Fimbriimonadaceae bacterium]|nr:glycosyltransferase [Fimbriimonadaceae bacterium]
MSGRNLALAEQWWAEGKLTEARALVTEILERDGPSYDALCAAGVLAYQAGETHRGKSALLQAVALHAERPEAYRQLGELLASEREVARAEVWLDALGDDPAALAALAVMYQESGLLFSAQRAARRAVELDPAQPGLASLAREIGAAFPEREVTVYVPCYNAAGCIGEVLAAVLAQSYPVHEVLVVDDGSTDGSLEVVGRFPVRVLQHAQNQGLSAARNTALLAASGEFIAHLDSDVVPDRHWLERLMLVFETERVDQLTGRRGKAPLGGVMGRLDERHDITLADQWRTVHMGQHHGDEARDEVLHLYGCNSLWRRDALVRAGGWDVRYRTNGEDCDCSERVRQLGFRLAYEPQARCEHLRRDTVASVLLTVWRYHTPYYEYRFGTFASGDLRDLMAKMPENLARHQDDWRIDQERRAHHLAYLTFLGLPWRVLSDLRLAGELGPRERAEVVQQTLVASFLMLFPLLAELGVREDLLQMVHEDLHSLLPPSDEPALRADWPAVAALLRAARGERSANPLLALPLRDTAAVDRCSQALAECWANLDEITWQMIRASAYRQRHEQAYRAGLPGSGPRIAVINAPWAADGRIGVRAGSRWPFTQDARGQRVPAYVPFPFFLATATAMLKNDGFEAVILDAIAEGLLPEEFLRRLSGYAPDVILMETATASHEIDLDWCLRFKERLGDQVQVILCGPHATALGEPLLQEAPQVDAVVLGEYEPSFLEMMQAQREGRTWDGIPGLLWRSADGTVQAQTARRKLPAMSAFPWPERETLPMYNYFDSFANAMPWPNVQMHASRGCPYTCIFCVWPQVVYDGQKYRTRDNADIVAEMQWLVDRYGFRAVYFDDDTFNIKDDRIIDLCNRIEAAQLGVPICAMGRADTCGREAFEAMTRAGLVGIKFGVETGDVEMMQRIRKNLDLDRVRQSVGWCRELGIGVHLTFSFGGPGETHETAEKTIRFALEMDPDSLQFSLMTPFPGTSMYAAAEAAGRLLTTDWKQYDGAQYTVVQGEFLSRDELEEMLREAHRRWLLHLTRRQLRQGLLPGELREAAVPADQIDALPPELDLLQVTTPVERLADLEATLDAAYRKVRIGGILNVVRGDSHFLPSGWDDQRLVRWQVGQRAETLAQLAGCQNELSLVLRRLATPVFTLR